MKQLLYIHNTESWVGKHCETTAVKHVLDYYGLDYSEDFLFGISGGIGFIYWYAKNMNVPFIGTKNKTRKGTIQEVCEKLNLNCQVKETASIMRAQRYLEKAVAVGKPLIVNVDLALLQYSGVPQNAHFGGHAVAVFGVDQEKSLVYILDRGRKLVSEPMESFQLARNSSYQPFSPKNRSFLIEPDRQNKLTKEELINHDMIIDSIRECVSEMMYPEIRNKGITGFDIWARKMKKWTEDFQGLALPDSCNYLKQVKETMYAKNQIFEDGKPDALSRLLELQQKQKQILEMAAEEAVNHQKEIISDLCQKVKRCKALEQDALSCLSSCLEN